MGDEYAWGSVPGCTVEWWNRRGGLPFMYPLLVHPRRKLWKERRKLDVSRSSRFAYRYTILLYSTWTLWIPSSFGYIFGCKPLSFWVAPLRFLCQASTITRFSATLWSNSMQIHHGSQVLEILCSVVFVFHINHILLQWAAFLSLEVWV